MAFRSYSVRSTAILSVDYDEELETLTVNFVNGHSYDHDGVPSSVVQALIEAPSPGSFYNSEIKGQY